MSMDKCPDCGIVVCDACAYYRVEIQKSGIKGSNKILLECPECGKVRPYGEWE